ncbi:MULTISPECIES: hypothetical protein [Stenotrophomonas]|jgi:hypothetical protein|uniref:Uncharacterized protein n=1 Tax=Stenotrophomonas pavanii TaxID=487698 RepID=A0A246KSQ3_9GAMM|nr:MULTISPECIES: hypothetical protein [Stenotrophomonas]MBC9080047.1 hypothetical protein [Stenotrophomonas maltophilia]MBC9094032.1 hypothetical protein [Stenotrophomonas maltophilia]MBH1390849.1 hypothetical protein [Stenotrophomonas maltophilia]MBH1522497.1 hypothetical protein [Stenotrophomonas maltophilia]MBN4943233.1 hypothetical protein [Stenotrophomonas maltophilia]
MDHSNLATTISQLLGRDPLPVDRAVALLESLAGRHGIDPRRVYWWAGIATADQTIQYDDSDEGLSCLAELLVEVNGEMCLVASDERALPWPIWTLQASELIPLLGELPFFEYFVVLDGGATLLFDTHHNALVVSRE